jgi:hypothetical protein
VLARSASIAFGALSHMFVGLVCRRSALLKQMADNTRTTS